MRVDCLLSRSRRSVEGRQIDDAAHAENLHQATQTWKISSFTGEVYLKSVVYTLAVFVSAVFDGEV